MQWILQDVPIGRNIQNIRMRKNMTQQDVVSKMQLMGSIMSRSTLANIETGRRNSLYVYFFPISRFLTFGIIWLIVLSPIHMFSFYEV